MDPTNTYMYVSDFWNHCVRRITIASGRISTAVGQCGRSGFSGDGGPATSALLTTPFHMSYDAAGDLYITSQHANCIKKVTTSTWVISTVAGVCGAGGYSGDGGQATAAW